MNFQETDPKLITPNPWNSNTVSDEMAERLRASIKRNGMFKPVLVRTLADGSLQSIGGQHRVEQAIRLGYKTVPVMNLGAIDDGKAKEISLADNARYGEDDVLKLSELLDSIGIPLAANILPFQADDLAELTKSLAVNLDDLDLDAIDSDVDVKENEDPDDAKPDRAAKTHQILRFKCSINNAAKISTLINQTMRTEGFNTEDDLTNAGDALAYLLLNSESDQDV